MVSGLRFLNHIAGIEVETGHRIAGSRVFGFFLNAHHLASLIKFNDTISLGIINIISKNNGSIFQ